jgi:uncharacterized membrane protein SpoIIM required for sporulation
MILERWMERRRGGGEFATTTGRSLLSWFLTFHFVVFSCLFIRAKSMDNLTDMVGVSGGESQLAPWGLVALIGGALTHFMPPAIGAWFHRRFVGLPTPVCGLLLGVVVGIVAVLVVGATPYIYFQF